MLFSLRSHSERYGSGPIRRSLIEIYAYIGITNYIFGTRTHRALIVSREQSSAKFLYLYCAGPGNLYQD